ncbi:MAG TPA: hypothetical protein DD379_26995 [Cyanobacteria bacterium UBA11162]|nr:hypothetical protein [Cyanobacteria bacterium UBA11162]
MATQIINLTLLKILGEVESILATYPAQTQKSFMKNLQLKEKLLSDVLNQLPNIYITIQANQTLPISPYDFYCSTLEQLEIEELIHQAINQLYHQLTHWNLYAASKKKMPNTCQSYCFADSESRIKTLA